MLRLDPRLLRQLLPGLFLLGPALLSGCGSEAKADVQPAAAAIDVDVAQAEERVVPKTIRLTGTLRGDQESKLSPNASGRVVEVKVDVGSPVKKGDILMKLDTRAASLVASEAGSQAELARTRRENAKRECERAKLLLEGGAISKAEHDKTMDQCKTSEIDVRSAEARASQAAQTLSDGTVKAPFDGIVAERLVEPGEYVRSDTPILRVATLKKLRLEIEVPEAFVSFAANGAKVDFGVSAYPGRSWNATIDRRGVAVRSASRDVIVEAPVDNPDGVLLSGMFASVDLTVGEEPMPVVPAASVFARDGKTHLFIDAAGRAEERAVQLGPRLGGDWVAVKRGVARGDSVITKRPDDLKNGAPVN
ncbi:MAG: efflux RND transporter periplasmic adaptor subunit [Polyangiaceae bacterium]|nr:efflux RND transporter periplasmic adaptor subunit [Polyangiaceae bacterium]